MSVLDSLMMGQGYRQNPTVGPQSTPPQQGGLGQASAVQSTNAAVGAKDFEEKTNLIQAGASVASPQPKSLPPEEPMQWLVNNVRTGLPSAQLAVEASRKRYMETLQPEEFSGMDNLALAMGSLKSEDFNQGNLGMALSKLGAGSVMGHKQYRDREMAKSKALLDEDQQQQKMMIDEAKIVQAYQAKKNKAGALAKNIDSAATQYAMEVVKKYGGNKSRAEHDKMFAEAYDTRYRQTLAADSAAAGWDDEMYQIAVSAHDKRMAGGYAPKMPVGEAAVAAPAASGQVATASPFPQGSLKNQSALKPATAFTPEEKAASAELESRFDTIQGFASEYRNQKDPAKRKLMLEAFPNDATTFDTIRKGLTTAAADGDTRTQEVLREVMDTKFPQGRASITAAPPPALTKPPTAVRETPNSIEVDKAGGVEQRKKNASTTEEHYAKAFETDVATPFAASQNLKSGVDQFINISSRANGLDSPKLKELAAGEAGKWAQMLLPKGDPLISDIANAQTAETLTSSMVQAILQAAKGVQTEGDAERAKAQIPSLGKDPKANAEFQAYINEVVERQKIRHGLATKHNKENQTWAGHDDNWQNSLYMAGVDGVRPQGLTKWVGSSPRGFTEYMQKFVAQHGARFGEGSVKAAIQSWNKLK